MLCSCVSQWLQLSQVESSPFQPSDLIANKALARLGLEELEDEAQSAEVGRHEQAGLQGRRRALRSGCHGTALNGKHD